MNILRTIVRWLIYSSANQEKISLTIKGAVSYLLLAFISLGLIHEIPSLNHLSSDVETAVLQVLQAISLLISAYGLFRKIFITIKNAFKK